MFKKIISLITIILFSAILAFGYTTSTNLSLRLPEATDNTYSVREDFNYNFNLVDDIFDTVSLTEFGYLNGVSSNIQDQFGLYYLKTAIDSETEMETIWGVGLAHSGANSDITSMTGLTTPLAANYGGTGVANNALSTLTISGNYATTLTVTGATGVTLPTTGTLATTTQIPDENAIEAYIFDADAESISGVWTVVDNVDLIFGTDSNWAIRYDEATDDQLTFITAGTAATATTDPLFEILVGTTPTANQEVFGVAKGTQSSNTPLFTLDEDGDVLIAGTLGVTGQISGNLTGDVTGNASGTAGVATAVTITDNESEAENNPIVFVANGDLDGGNLGLESDGTMYYTPSTGKITATGFVGTLTGNVTGDVTGNADTVTGFTPASGSLTLSGADALTLTTTAETNVTLPTTGTLLANVVEDTTPELGGEMDAGAHSIGFTQQTATGDGSTTIDWRLGNKFYFTFGNANETFTFTAPSNPCNIVLVLKQYSTGGKSATWPATVMWPGGTAPTLSTGNNDIDIVTFYYDGTNYFGVFSLDFSVPA